MTSFLIDQQLPARLAAHGHDATHIKQYPGGPTMEDQRIAQVADLERRTVVTKDDDFRILHLTLGTPAQIVLVTCGNISTSDLLALFDEHLDDIAAATGDFRHVELHRSGVYVHDPN